MSFQSERQRKAVMAILGGGFKRFGRGTSYHILYHFTPRKNVPKIAKRGLIPSRAAVKREEKYFPEEFGVEPRFPKGAKRTFAAWSRRDVDTHIGDWMPKLDPVGIRILAQHPGTKQATAPIGWRDPDQGYAPTPELVTRHRQPRERLFIPGIPGEARRYRQALKKYKVDRKELREASKRFPGGMKHK